MLCKENFGALCHVTIPRKENDKNIPLLSSHSMEEFSNIWSTFNSELFAFKKSIWGVKRNEFCHAGEWSGLLNLGTGIWTPCYSIRAQKRNMFKNPDEPFVFYPVGHHCNMPHCYNGHSFLSMGDIPEIDTYRYDQLRDRTCEDGATWLTDDTRNFYHGRLNDGKLERYSQQDKLKFSSIKTKTIVNNIIAKATHNTDIL